MLCILAVVLLVPAIGAKVQPRAYEGGRSRDVAQRAERNSSAVASMLGDFRTSASDMMYIKTERYMHSGVGVEGCVVQTVKSVAEESKDIDRYQASLALPHESVDDKKYKGENLLPSSLEDFRGFVGQLHRKVVPYFAPGSEHVHSDGQELLPWFRLMTISDPHYVRGYSVGAWWLGTKDLDEALAFANEGLEHNPKSYQIHFTKGQILMKKARLITKDGRISNLSGEALAMAVRAKEAYQHAAVYALEERPVGGMENDLGIAWGRFEEDDALASMRLSVMTELEYGDMRKALQLAQRYSRVVPEDRTLARLLGKASMMVDEKEGR